MSVIINTLRVEDWDEFPNFSREEFDHGGPEMALSFLVSLQQARTICENLCKDAGEEVIPFIINSGSRSKERNRQVGGKPDSSHLIGHACDIRAISSRDRFFIMKSLMLAGLPRIGSYYWGFHVDNDPRKDWNVLF